jgi:type I restriction enzyme, R subunit
VADEVAYLSPEAAARVEIDRMLVEAGWAVQSADRVNLRASLGVAVREFMLKPPHGRVDYLLFVDGQAVGVLEAKKEGLPLVGVEWQSARYVVGLPPEIPRALEGPLPFAYESTGVETRFTNTRDPEPASRPVFWFHQPTTLARWVDEMRRDPEAPTLRYRLQAMPEPDLTGLWPPKDVAVRNLERSLRENRPRALIQMATGSGKTLLAAFVSYRLVKFADARRVLFLVDRANLGRQTLKEFQGFTTPDDGRKFTELYNVQHLSSNVVDPVARVTISTIQRVYSILRGEPDLDPELDEHSAYELAEEPVPVEYNASVPPETFDVVIVDECHRSIYGLWRQVLDYFDAFTVGLTATPNKQAFGFFNQNLVMEYGHDQAVADGVNVDFDVYRIRTEITERGSTIDAGIVTQFRDRQTRRTRWEKLDEDLTYTAQQLDRAVVARDQIRTVLEVFRDKLPTEIFPGRTEVPKTLIFAKDDAHADEIVQIARDVFAKGNDFAAKITYKTSGRKTDDLIAEFRNSYNPRIAVTVDMIATGTDVKPLECVFFMRSVKSRTYFEQMKGRGVRVINDADFQAVTPDSPSKERFVLVDAVGVTDTDLVDTPPLDREPTVLLERLLKQLSWGNRDPNLLSTIAARLARLDRRLSKEDRGELEQLSGGTSLKEIASAIVDALDPDRQLQAAQAASGSETPSIEDIALASRSLLDTAVEPLAANPELRERIVEVRRSYEQVIDEGADNVLQAGYSKDAADRARKTVESWEQFVTDHKDEITALQILYSRLQAQRLTFREVKELAQTIGRPPYQWTPEKLWEAYEQLDRSKVRGSGQRILTDLVSLVRVALRQEDELVPYTDQVRERYRAWLLQQENTGRTFTAEQLAWLERIRDHVAASLSISTDDFSYTPFVEAGGLGRASQVFGDELRSMLDQLNEALVA